MPTICFSRPFKTSDLTNYLCKFYTSHIYISQPKFVHVILVFCITLLPLTFQNSLSCFNDFQTALHGHGLLDITFYCNKTWIMCKHTFFLVDKKQPVMDISLFQDFLPALLGHEMLDPPPRAIGSPPLHVDHLVIFQ